MTSYRKSIYLLLLITVVVITGCARAARDTRGFAAKSSITVNAPFAETWQTVKKVLIEQNLDIYTRDKRGTFVVFSSMKRRLMVPHRTKHTIILERESDNKTHINIESINQIYGVTLLTYPNWHDRKTSESKGAQKILNGIKASLDQE